MKDLLMLDDTPTIDEIMEFWETIRGAERGTNQHADIITQSADGADLNTMWREFQRTIRMHNTQRDSLLALLTYNVTNPTERVLQPSEEDFEEASEFGEPKGVRIGTPFVLGFGFKWYDLAARYTWMFLAENTQNQIEAINNSILDADNRLMFTQVLKTIFNPTNLTATINNTAVNVYKFYNADGTVPPKWKNTTFAGSHTHYLSSGAATIDSGDLDDIETHLKHHGYTQTDGYRLVLLVNSQEGAVVRTFRVANGDTYDFIPSPGYGAGIYLPQNGGIIDRPAGTVRGQIGTYGPFIVVEEDYLPAGYVFGFATGGEENIGNPVGIREHDNASLRGLRLVKGREPDYPLVDSFYQHGFGTGIRHRGAGVVMQITAGAYSTPAAYA
jgi:hypothetical protein